MRPFLPPLLLLLASCVYISDDHASWRLDPDGDGVLFPDDCDDEDSQVGAAITWYEDYDEDGWGSESSTFIQCEQKAGFVELPGDCDDSLAAVNPDAAETCNGIDDDCDGETDESDAQGSATWYLDVDGDDHGDPDQPLQACDQPSGYVAGESAGVDFDCDDGDAQVHPGADEVCNDDIDDDCDGLADDEDPDVELGDEDTWYGDADGDGYGDSGTTDFACDQPSGFVAYDGDCNDDDEDVNPDAEEICNRIDDDCDKAIDDQDDDLDEDSATAWYQDADGDGFGHASSHELSCEAPKGYVDNGEDCDDGDDAINPDADEICDEDDTDEDCDKLADDDDKDVLSVGFATWYADADGDGFGDRDVDVQACDAPSGYTDDDQDCDDADAAINPDASEVCDANDVDEDCDGLTDDDDDSVDESTYLDWYADGDGDGYGDAATTAQACDAPSGYTADGTDCDDDDDAINPGASEVCDLDDTDEDCNGLADDDDSGVDNSTYVDWYVDADNDGFGDADAATTSACNQPSGHAENGEDCDDGDGAISPTAQELCNGIDDDCDGMTDDDDDDTVGTTTYYRDYDGDGYGAAGDIQQACIQPVGYVPEGTDCIDTDAGVHPGATDDSVDGIDQDCDGTDGSPLSVADLVAGDLVISEVMQNPNAVSDSNGEWFEVYNASGSEVELLDLYVYDDGTNAFTVSTSATLEAGGFFVFANDASTATNGGKDVDYEYSTADMALGNGEDEIYLSNGSVVIDGVGWDNGATFPDPTGASMTLDPDLLDANANDDGSAWCQATTSFGDGDLGTPGAANDDCATWTGTRELHLDLDGYGPICELWWDSAGTASSNICSGCDWAYDLEFTYLGDLLGGCDASSYLPAYTVGLHPAYYFAGYGSYDMLMLYYGSTWYTQFFVDQYGGGSLEYSTRWDTQGSYYYYLYYWYGVASYQ